MYDASNRKDIRRAEKTARQAERSRIDYTKTIMSDPPGRQWMHALLLRCNVFHTPFVRGSADGTAFNCGGQNIGLQIFADVVTHCPNQYILMIQEASTKELANDRHDSNDRRTSPATLGQHPGVEDNGRDVEGSGEYDPYTYTDE